MKLESISKKYNQTVIFSDFSLEVPDGTITCLIGPSGCGKSTLLNIISGLERADSGSVSFSGEGKISYLFQEPRLLPKSTVLDNVAIPLGGDREAAREMLETVGLGDSLGKYPSQLSGGQKQRVAIARAFCFPSGAILLDEPFQSLDVRMRNNLSQLFLTLWESNPKTVLWVTHDIMEACFAADRIVVVTEKPMKVYRKFLMRTVRKNRTPENVSPVSAAIYRLLTNQK